MATEPWIQRIGGCGGPILRYTLFSATQKIGAPNPQVIIKHSYSSYLLSWKFFVLACQDVLDWVSVSDKFSVFNFMSLANLMRIKTLQKIECNLDSCIRPTEISCQSTSSASLGTVIPQVPHLSQHLTPIFQPFLKDTVKDIVRCFVEVWIYCVYHIPLMNQSNNPVKK